MRTLPGGRTLSGMSWDHMSDWGSAYLVFLSVVWLVAVVVIGRAAVTILRSGVSAPSSRDVAPLRDVFDERLARGEIDLEQYRKLRAAIDDPVSPGERVPQR
jgi:uncharacterized membrane protein